jgi:glutaminyl-peptide cyclotransferase
MSRRIGGVLVALAALGALGGFLMLKPWNQIAAEPPKQKEEFAADREAPNFVFDAKRAMNYLEELCKIGPRISATAGMKQQQETLKKHFETHGAKVELQRFTAKQVSQKQPVEMANLIASWFPERTKRVILCSHYDTRPIADQEPNPRRWREPFVSANDGGSGVALLMELAHHVKDMKSEVGIDFVLFDGEEYIFEPRNDKYFFGSEHFAENYSKSRLNFRYGGAVLLDMIGGKDAKFPKEPNSVFHAGKLTDDLWKIAAELNCAAFENGYYGREVLDDHIALNRVGIPAVDIIDFEYTHWHRLSDVPAQCSAESLEQVAHVLMVWVQRIK